MERLWDHPPPPKGTAQRGMRPRNITRRSDRPRLEVGIQPPPMHPPPRQARTPHYLRGSCPSTPTEERRGEKRPVSCLQFGDRESVGFVHQMNHVPELPVYVRARASQRLGRDTTREVARDPQQTFATMYFGEDIDNVIGCWSLRRPFPRARSATVAAMERVIDRHFAPQHLAKGRFP